MVIFGGGCTGKICIVHYSHIQYQGYLNLLDGKKKKHGKKGTEKKKKQHSFLPCSIINGSFLSGSEYLIFLLHGLNTPLIY